MTDAEDMTSLVFVGALKSIKNFTWQQATFSSWLYRIAHNVVVDHWRKKGRVKFEPIDETLRDSADVQKDVLDSFRNQELYDAIDKLPEDQSRVIVLRFINGLSINETAEAMEKTVGAVKAQQFRAMENLRDIIGEMNG